jgi:conjugative transfer region protein (TIGR03748 family)
MRPFVFHPPHVKTMIAICAAIICGAASINLQAKDLQVGRYSLYKATPTQAQSELLATIMTVRFPNRIQGVGEAVRYLLQRSGYRLADIKSTGPDTAAMFDLPIPAVHRSLGPMTLRDALEILAGPAFHLVQDPVHRLVSFERCSERLIQARTSRLHIEQEVTPDAN